MPLAKGLGGGHHRALVLVAPADQLEQQVCMAVASARFRCLAVNDPGDTEDRLGEKTGVG